MILGSLRSSLIECFWRCEAAIEDARFSFVKGTCHFSVDLRAAMLIWCKLFCARNPNSQKAYFSESLCLSPTLSEIVESGGIYNRMHCIEIF